MNEQLVQQITDNISKNSTCESYHIQKFFGDKPIEEYSFLRFMEEYKDGSIAPGITDSEIIDILLNRIKTNKVSFKYIDTNDKLIREHIISSLENLQELIDG